MMWSRYRQMFLFLSYLVCTFIHADSYRDNEDDILRNLALNKAAYQSTTYKDVRSYGADKAVDGIRQSNWVPPFCTHTTNEYTPFWYVDLGGQHDIIRVEILNRLDTYTSHLLRDISVVVGQVRGGGYDQTCGHFRGPGTTDVPVINFKCPDKTRGQFVKVQMATGAKYPLILCEVEVWGY